MAGHSQWANRKHRKQRQDKKRGKIFSKMARKITMAAREGGGDPETNARLRMLIDKAKGYDVPNDNIERAIKRGTGELEGVEYQEFTYEGYGPGGVALYLDIVTDNRNRTASEVRHIFSRHNGNLGESGSVAWLFERKGHAAIKQAADIDEEELLLVAMEAGAEDMDTDEEMINLYCDVAQLQDLQAKLDEAGYEVEDADLTMIPTSTVTVSDNDARQLLKLLDALDDHDDVQEVYGNFEIADEVMQAYAS